MIKQLGPPTGARARYHATSDDTVVEGDVLGVRVIDGAAHFFRNGRRLAFSAGGRGSNQLQDAGWGRPIPLSQDLVPIVEVHAREPDDDDEAMAPWRWLLKSPVRRVAAAALLPRAIAPSATYSRRRSRAPTV